MWSIPCNKIYDFNYFTNIQWEMVLLTLRIQLEWKIQNYVNVLHVLSQLINVARNTNATLLLYANAKHVSATQGKTNELTLSFMVKDTFQQLSATYMYFIIVFILAKCLWSRFVALVKCATEVW